MKEFKKGDYIVPIAGSYNELVKLNHVYKQIRRWEHLIIASNSKNNEYGFHSLLCRSISQWRYATNYEISMYELVNRPISLQNLVYPGDIVECILEIHSLEYSKQGLFIPKGEQFTVEDTLIVKGKFYIYFKDIPGVYHWKHFRRDIQAMIERDSKILTEYGGTEICLNKMST